MSASFARSVVAGLRAHGIHVDEHPGCYSRGNGQQFANDGAPDGHLTHHTASRFDAGFDLLVNGRSDLSGPLCNMCTWRDGHVTLIAAFPANHAGASGGKSMGPLPKTRSFNKHVWGNEVMYPGTEPMTDAQYRTALIMAGVVCGILKRPNPEWARFHASTSVTGKWDAGYAPGKTYDLAKFHRDIWPALNAGGTPAPSGPPAGGLHVVVHGDTLWGLAQRFSVTVDALRAWNPWIRADIIVPGQQVRVAAPSPATPPATSTPVTSGSRAHTVAAGDTLWGIAHRYGVSVDAVKAANGLRTDLIGVGQRLVIPPTAPAAPPPAPVPTPTPTPAPAPAQAPLPMSPTTVSGVLVGFGMERPVELAALFIKAGVEPAVGAAFCEQESSTARNVWGHDGVDPKGLYVKGAPVTLEAYAAYAARRKHHDGPAVGDEVDTQGVGPLQITHWSLQDECDQRLGPSGGTWVWEHNVEYGLGLIRSYLTAAAGEADPVWAAAKRYNGKAAYADELIEKVAMWRDRMAGALTDTTPPPVVAVETGAALAAVADIRAALDRLARALSEETP